MAGAGLGLRLHDVRFGTTYHQEAFAPWWRHARREYLALDREQPPGVVSLYYDPLLRLHHRLPVRAALINCFYLAPQVPEESRRLFAAAAGDAGLLGDPTAALNAHRAAASALFLAREWGMDELHARLQAAVEEHGQPTWDRERGEFTWGLGLGEEHPRGQYNAYFAAAEAVSPGAWAALAAAPLGDQPVVEGVDFPRLALAQARWRGDQLHLLLAPLPGFAGEPTSFAVRGLIEPAKWRATGPPGTSSGADDRGRLVVSAVAAPAAIVIRRGE